MALRNLVNAAVETSNSTGTGSLTLDGAKKGYFSIPEGFVGDVHILAGEHSEISRCKVLDGKLERLDCIKSTNDDDFVDFPSGEKDVAAVLTKEYLKEMQPDVEIDQIKGLNKHLRQYIAMYSELMRDRPEDIWVFWSKIMGKPDAYPPEDHEHSFDAFEALDYESDNLVNKPRKFGTAIEAPLFHSHGSLDRRQKSQAVRRAYMYGGS